VTDEAFAEFYQPITHRFQKLWLVKSGERRRLVRRMVTEVEADLYRGQRNPEVLEETARQIAESEFRSILVIIGLAVLTELVRYIVRKLLERWETIQGPMQ